MWNQGSNYSDQELEVVKELERELFRYNPGFRAMWHDDFEEFFKGTFSEEYWNEMEKKREKELEDIIRKRMVEDFEYVKFRHEQALIEETLFGDHIFSLGSNYKSYELYREKWEDDKLYQTAKDWGWKFFNAAIDLYQKDENIHMFRILKNVNYVPSKIIFASAGSEIEEDGLESLEDLAWNTSWIGYNLSLIFLNRSLESLLKFQKENQETASLDYDYYIDTGKKIRFELMDRLENLHQKALSKNIYGYV